MSAERIEEQRQVIFDAQAILSVCAAAMEQEPARGEPDYSGALEGAHRLLDRAAEALELIANDLAETLEQKGGVA